MPHKFVIGLQLFSNKTGSRLKHDTIFYPLANSKLWFYQAFGYKKEQEQFHPAFKFQRKLFYIVKQIIFKEIYRRNIAYASNGHQINSNWIL